MQSDIPRLKRELRSSAALRQAMFVLMSALAFVAGAAQAQEADRPAAPAADPSALKAGNVPVPPPPPGAVLPPVEPIVTDEEFNAAIPPLDASSDPELDRPLESIADFERQLGAKAAGEPGVPPALDDGDPIEEIGDAPISDAELLRPLPPLAEFEVEPVQIAESGEDELVEVAYSVRINGLEPADRATETDLQDQFDDLSALEDGDGKAANAAMVAARLREDSILIQRLLASEGWLDSRVSTRIDRSEAANGQPLTAIIDVVPGKRFALSEIRIDAGPTVPADLISRNLALTVGEPIVATRVQGAEAQVAVALPQEGYPFAQVGQRDILLDPDDGRGVYTLPVTVGPRARFGGFRTFGDLAFDAKHVDVLARFERGELYDSRKVDDLRKALVATGLFNTISVLPEKTGQSAGDGTEYVTMAVEQDAGPPRTLAGSAGYATGEGFRLEGSWTHRNFFPPEGALIARGVAGTKEQGAGVTFRRSNAGKRDRTVEVVAEALHSNYDAFEAFTGRLSGRVSRESTPIWQKKVTYAYGAELIGTIEEDFNFTLGDKERRTFYIAGLTGQIGLDLSDDLLNPTKGARATALVQPEVSLQGGDFRPYARARFDVSGYYPATEAIVLAGRARIGTIQGIERSEIAPSRRLYGGGGGSVRGFGYQELGPRDPNNDPLGGRSLIEGAAEVRYRFGNFGVVGFVDAGQVYEESFPTLDDLRFGVGVGGRFYTNFGPLRVDVATPLKRRKGETRFNIYVSIGQAF